MRGCHDDEVEFGEHVDELTSGTASLDAVVGRLANLDILHPPKKSVVAGPVAVDVRTRGLRNVGFGDELLFLPLALVHDEHADLEHVAGEEAASCSRLGKVADGIFPLVIGDADGLEQLVLDKIPGSFGSHGVEHLHRDVRIGFLILELTRHGRNRGAVLEVGLDFALPLELGGVLEQLPGLFIVKPDAGIHLHDLGEGDGIGTRSQSVGVEMLEEGDDRLVEILHLQVAHLHRPSDRKSCV